MTTRLVWLVVEDELDGPTMFLGAFDNGRAAHRFARAQRETSRHLGARVVRLALRAAAPRVAPVRRRRYPSRLVPLTAADFAVMEPRLWVDGVELPLGTATVAVSQFGQVTAR